MPKLAYYESLTLEPKPAIWLGPTQRIIRGFPRSVRQVIGYALEVAQRGGRHPDAKPLRGFKGAGVLEVVENHEGNAYRAVYTVKLADHVYVLHAFQKKAKKEVRTPKREIELIRKRLREAEQIQGEWEKVDD